MYFIKTNNRHRQNVAFCTRNIYWKASKKAHLVESFKYEMAVPESQPEGLYTDLFYLTKLFKKDDFWQLLLNSLREFLLTYLSFSLCKFLSAVIFYNVTPNVNKNLLQIALLKRTPFRISMPLSFLEDLTQIIFSN